jgi:threonine dehydrogenase-like Zn-dependent dehydrogenase
MPQVLDLLAQKKIALSAIHTIASWDEAIDALRDPPLKLVLTH